VVDAALPQAVQGEALAFLRRHQPAADEVVFSRVEDIFFLGLDELLGVPCVPVGHGSYFVARLNLLELLIPARQRDVVERGAHDFQLLIHRLVAFDNAQPRVFHLPDGVQHPQAEGWPVYVLRGTDKGLRRATGYLEVLGKGTSHWAVDDGGDVTSFLHEVVYEIPAEELHGDDEQPIGRRFLKLLNVDVDGGNVIHRLSPDFKFDPELFGGVLEDFCVQRLSGLDVVLIAGPAYHRAFTADFRFRSFRANENHSDDRLAEGLGLCGQKR